MVSLLENLGIKKRGGKLVSFSSQRAVSMGWGSVWWCGAYGDICRMVSGPLWSGIARMLSLSLGCFPSWLTESSSSGHTHSLGNHLQTLLSLFCKWDICSRAAVSKAELDAVFVWRHAAVSDMQSPFSHSWTIHCVSFALTSLYPSCFTFCYLWWTLLTQKSNLN